MPNRVGMRWLRSAPLAPPWIVSRTVVIAAIHTASETSEGRAVFRKAHFMQPQVVMLQTDVKLSRIRPQRGTEVSAFAGQR